ncbi:thiamine phosphate synthase [Corynebacterium aquatimens]|uniref:Thiamine-phosphate synthase n=1 Tax=Corynebacterium aquatimens TaxID=1190508 RepID=A0A931DYG0_9CORY|nr:thiamine phosphate synthase [Corynebacterium aquatimens]MBG6122672.1 thiamine-phosphate diphosphorylase [Corynebacterium aquatimens]WJY64797.1 Thiamine-phosphate synthase [Corynebacterium aquatimens]
MNIPEGIYLVTDKALCGERGVVETVRLAVDGGVTTVQLRDKDAGRDDLVRQLEELAGVIDGRATLVVNDALDAAVEARRRGIPIDGVHVGQSDEDATVARAHLGPDAVVGLSASNREEFAEISTWPAGTVDYVGVGVIRPTATKKNHPPALGIEGFGELTRIAPVPTVAIGGVGAGDIVGLRQAGAHAVAVVSAICAAEDPRGVAEQMSALWISA